MLNLVFLPAAEPGDDTFGAAPERIEEYPNSSIYHVRYPSLAWYNESIRREAIAQIRAFGVDPIVLIGFSKSGLGAWNIACAIPDLVCGTIIFDAPVATVDRQRYDAGSFYNTDSEWLADLPIHTVSKFRAAMPETHSLVLVSGEAFHSDMHALSQALSGSGVEHMFLPRPYLAHHWTSGWIEEGLDAIIGGGTYHDS